MICQSHPGHVTQFPVKRLPANLISAEEEFLGWGSKNSTHVSEFSFIACVNQLKIHTIIFLYFHIVQASGNLAS